MIIFKKIKSILKFIFTPWNSEKKSSRFFGTLLLLLVIILFCAAFQGIQYFTSTNQFCASCHEMKFSYQYYKNSIHGSNSLGISVNCVDCHIPVSLKGYLKVKGIDTLKDAYKHFFHPVKTEEEWLEKKEELDEYARKSVENANCMKCHKNAKPKSEEGKEMHDEMDLESDKCVDCHTDMFHIVN